MTRYRGLPDFGLQGSGLIQSQFVEVAAAWLRYAEGHWHAYPEREDVGYFGTGTVAIQSVEAVAEHAFVCAALAHPRAVALDSGLSPDTLAARALAALRFLVGTHRTGKLQCMPGGGASGRRGGEQPGGQWGGDGWTPVPAFFTFLVAEALGDALPAAGRAAVDRLLEYEAEANLADQRCTVLEHHGHFREVPPIPTGRFGTSWPESNAWRGAALAAATLRMSAHPHAAAWDESMKRHFVNALSVPRDAGSEAIVDGRPVRERFVGANVHPHFALEHHGFFHPCYAARTMEFMVLTAWAFRRRGRPVPECTRHHLLDEWQMLRRLILWQGRLAYPAGKDHHRYGWGLTYLLPVLAWLEAEEGDAAAGAYAPQLAELFLGEQRHNGDGSFVRERMGALLDPVPGPQRRAGDRSAVLYYRAEADPPFYLLLAALVAATATGARPAPVAVPARVGADGAALLGSYEEPDAGLVLRRDPGRFASWSWNAHPDVEQGLFVPRDGDHLAEWNGNLAPNFVVLDASLGRSVAWQRTTTFDGGFATLGVVRHAGGALEQHVLFAALPDGRSAVYADDVRARWDVTLLHQEGLRLNLGNDLFNGYRRRLRFEGGEAPLAAGAPPDPRLDENTSDWLVVDDLLGVQFLGGPATPWTVRTFAQRNATDMSAWYAILCRPLRSGPQRLSAGGVVEQTAARLVANPEGEWRAGGSCVWSQGDAPAAAIDVDGLDGRRYRLSADWAQRRIDVTRE